MRSWRVAANAADHAGRSVRVVLDTNVLISALLFGGVPEVLLRRGLEGEFVMISSGTLLDELEDTLIGRFAFARNRARLTRDEFEAVMDLVHPPTVPSASRDPDDDHVLAAAVVTGDKDLLVLEEHEGVAILTPRGFSETLP